MKVRYLKIQEHKIDLLMYNFSYIQSYFDYNSNSTKQRLIIVCLTSGYKAFEEVVIYHDSLSKLQDIQDVLDCRKKEWLMYKGITKILNV